MPQLPWGFRIESQNLKSVTKVTSKKTREDNPNPHLQEIPKARYSQAVHKKVGKYVDVNNLRGYSVEDSRKELFIFY